MKTSCGFSVPLYEYQGERDALIKWAENKDDEGLAVYQREKNSVSIDSLPTPLSLRT